MKPLRDYILIDPILRESVVDLPDGYEPDPNDADSFVVVAVGDDVSNVKEGDEVVIIGFVRMFKYNKQKYITVQEDEIAFIVENDDKIQERT